MADGVKEEVLDAEESNSDVKEEDPADDEKSNVNAINPNLAQKIEVKLEEGDSAADTNTYPCDQCNFTASVLMQLKYHKEKTHGRSQHFCDECTFVAATESQLDVHKNSEHRDAFSTTILNYSKDTLRKSGKGFNDQSTSSNTDQSKLREFSCDICGYTAPSAVYLRIHKESKHEGVRYQCDHCDHVANQFASLRRHIETKHEGLRYPCDQCEFVATQSGSLKRHVQNLHQGVRYPCDQCDFIATQAGHLKNHIEVKHEGVQYPCTQCDYVAAQPGNLKIHIQSKHYGLRYLCDQCDFKATTRGYLKKHKDKKHNMYDKSNLLQHN